MSVHEIKRTSLMNVPQRLRELAEVIQRQGHRTALVIVGHANGQVSIRGYGDRTSALEGIGWLHRALDAMTHGSMAEDITTLPPNAS